MTGCAPGSSPLARGLLGALDHHDHRHGIIPARAGFTMGTRVLTPDTGDHPRSRGVYKRGRGEDGRRSGSSPLARGLPRRRSPGAAPPPDHPRSRGVYCDPLLDIALHWGSSPLARGLREEGRKDWSDHPRSRGVYSADPVRTGSGAGSSPLARGLRRQVRRQQDHGGIIPARAGFTEPRSRAHRPRRIIPARAGFTRLSQWPHEVSPDHPRSRGVYTLVSNHSATIPGSSPLARGLHQGRVVHPVGREDHPRSRGVYMRRPSPPRRALWIIPARAGFTHPRRSPSAAPGDHPRSRGVYWVCPAVTPPASGSSPLARGLQILYNEEGTVEGIIPARAGFTAVDWTDDGTITDHPRSRGVYVLEQHDYVLSLGSSPLARGLRWSRAGAFFAPGIIPARAGFTQVGQDVVGEGPDHPRSRGVYRPARPSPGRVAGSSPLARGLLLRLRGGQVLPGIIPARAGFTGGPHYRYPCAQDHPRSRGVYEPPGGVMSPASGSSPLARGLRGCGHCGRRVARIIPARAGFTIPRLGCRARCADHPRSRGVYSWPA